MVQFVSLATLKRSTDYLRNNHYTLTSNPCLLPTDVKWTGIIWVANKVVVLLNANNFIINSANCLWGGK